MCEWINMYLVRRKLQYFLKFPCHVLLLHICRISIEHGLSQMSVLLFLASFVPGHEGAPTSLIGDYLINNSDTTDDALLQHPNEQRACMRKAGPVTTTQDLAANLSAEPIMHCRHPALGPVLSLNAQNDCALSLSFSIRETNTFLLDYWRILPRGIWSGKTAHGG